MENLPAGGGPSRASYGSLDYGLRLFERDQFYYHKEEVSHKSSRCIGGEEKRGAASHWHVNMHFMREQCRRDLPFVDPGPLRVGAFKVLPNQSTMGQSRICGSRIRWRKIRIGSGRLFGIAFKSCLLSRS